MIGAAALFLLAASPAAIPTTAEVLERAGKSTQKFWDQFAAVTCTESVTQLKLGPKGKPVFRADSAYDYLVMLQLSGTDFVVQESRVPLKPSREAKTPREPRAATPLLVTNGFSTLLLIFHPFFQASYEYAPPEPGLLDGKTLLRVRFRHTGGGRSPSVLKLGRREYPLQWRGSAWLDPASGAIVKIEAGLQSSMEDIGLKTLNASVRYTPLRFNEDSEVHWLPLDAEIETETLHQHWRNTHRFSGYKQFSVNTREQLAAPKPQ